MRPASWTHRLLRLAAATRLAVVLAALGFGPAVAAELPAPTGEVVLIVSGQIAYKNGPEGARFDRAMLEALGTASLQTSTPWTEGVPVFRGQLMRDVLRRVGARGTRVRATALNVYSFEIPISDFEEYQVLLASEMNGRTLTVREKGPLWIVYPLDRLTSGRDREIERKMVWQLSELHVQ